MLRKSLIPNMLRKLRLRQKNGFLIKKFVYFREDLLSVSFQEYQDTNITLSSFYKNALISLSLKILIKTGVLSLEDIRK